LGLGVADVVEEDAGDNVASGEDDDVTEDEGDVVAVGDGDDVAIADGDGVSADRLEEPADGDAELGLGVEMGQGAPGTA
jgi:hypothetical protein